MALFIRNPYGYIQRENGLLYYQYSYQLVLAPESTERSFRLPLAYWGGYDPKNAKIQNVDDDVNETANNIWSEHVFSRGRYFRELEGGNLPSNYPVIARFEDGVATSIKSMDLTAPSYQSAENLSKQVSEHAQKLGGFKGTKNWGKDGITISENQISSRVLRLVIPENTPQQLLQTLRSEQRRLANEGISLDWQMHGKSDMYIKDDEFLSP